MTRWFLGLALAVTLAATYFAPRADESNVVAPAKARADAPRAAGAAATPRKRPAVDGLELRIHPRKPEQELGNVFAGQSWTPPPAAAKPASAQQAAPPAPQAPPLPFRFLGRLVDNGKTAYFLQFNDRNLVLQPGDAVDQTYTLDSASGGMLTFTYLPLKQQQTLVVGEVN